mgnify:FL=1
MPFYGFKNDDTGEIIEKTFSYASKLEFKEANPEWRDHITVAPQTISSSGKSPATNSDGAWTEVMSRVAGAHPNSEVGERYGKKSIKNIKTKQVIDKHRESLKSRIETE